MKQLTCKQCGKVFEAKRDDAKFCSQRCQKADYRYRRFVRDTEIIVRDNVNSVRNNVSRTISRTNDAMPDPIYEDIKD